MFFSAQDAQYMAIALRLAERGQFTVAPNPMVGCVIVNDGEVVGEGWHEQAGCAHAEVHALAMAGTSAKGATVYVTLEPCSHHGKTPPCADALIHAEVARVVVAMKDPNPLVSGSGLAKLRAVGIQVDVGLLESSARALNLGFIARMEQAMPYVRAKVASSLDGHTALSNGESHWITSHASREDVHILRARSGAIVTGIGTVLADDPRLTVRIPEWEDLQPLRVVLDGQLRCKANAQLFDQPGNIVIVCSEQALLEASEQSSRLQDRGAQVISVASDDTGLDLTQVLSKLATGYQINDVLLEAGPRLTGSALMKGLVNELWWYTSGALMGHAARSSIAFAGAPIEQMSLVQRWQLIDQRRLGNEDLRTRWAIPSTIN